MKKNFIILAAMMLLGIFTPQVRANWAVVAPSGQTIYYYYDNGIVITFPNADSSNPWGNYTKPTGDLIIPDSITLNGVKRPVRFIRYQAFATCNGLTSVTIPGNIASIGDQAFYGCSGLTTFNFNADSCTYMGRDGYRVFQACSSLTTLNIGNNVKCIPEYAFRGCSGLTGTLTIPSSVAYIGAYAFSGCSGLTGITIPNSVISIGNNAFSWCSGLSGTITIPNSVTFIGYSAFEHCSGLTGSLIIPNSVTSIGYYAFRNCSGLTSLTISSSVTRIGDAAFENCSGLTAVNFNADSCTYMGRAGQPVFLNCTSLTTFNIGNNVKRIPNYALYSCSGLTDTFTIPNSVICIGNNAFDSCSGLTFLIIGNSVSSIGNNAFRGCNGLTSLIIPNSVTNIGNNTFDGCSGLTSVTIGNSVSSIGEQAFFDCHSLLNVVCKSTYPPTAQSNTFERLPAYCTLTVPCGSLPYYNVTEPWNSQFQLKNEDCRPEYTVTVESADPTMGIVSGGGQVLEGDETIITATANEGYHFVRWQDNNTDNPRTITVTANVTYTAYFEAETQGVVDVAWNGIDLIMHGTTLIISGVTDEHVHITDLMGRTIHTANGSGSIRVELPVAGVYFVRVGDRPARKILVIQ